GDAARPLGGGLPLAPAPMAEPGTLRGLAQLVFAAVGFGNVTRDTEDARGSWDFKKISATRRHAPPASICMGKPDDLDDFRAQYADAFADCLCDALPIVWMYEILDPLAEQTVLGYSEHLSYRGTLIGDDTIAIEDGENIARILDQRAI